MIRRLLLSVGVLAALMGAARADFAFTLGSGATGFSFTSTTGGSSICAAASTHCFASVPIDTAGAQLFASGNGGYVRFPSAQAVTVSGVATAAKQPALGTAGTASVDVITVQGAASMTPLFGIVRDAAGNARGANVNASNQLSVSCDNGCSALTNISQLAGNAIALGPGSVTAGTIRTETASDSPEIAILNSINTNIQGSIPAGTNPIGKVAFADSIQRELGAKIPGAAPTPIQVVIADQLITKNPRALFDTTDALGQSRSAAMITDGVRYASLTKPGRGAIASDVGLVVSKSAAPTLICPFTVSINTTAALELVPGVPGTFLHVCSFGVIAGGAESVSLVEGAGSVCGTGTSGLYGGTSASAALAANGGLHGVSPEITIPMKTRGDSLCLLKSASNNVSGILTYGIFN